MPTTLIKKLLQGKMYMIFQFFLSNMSVFPGYESKWLFRLVGRQARD